MLAYTTAPTGEAPGIDFIDWSSPVASISIDDSEAYAPPALATAPLAPGFGGMLAIFVHGQQPPVPAAALAAELSAFLTIKS